MFNTGSSLVGQVQQTARPMAGLNPDQKAKEEESQIITVRGNDNRVIVQAPQIQKIFQGLGIDRDDIRIQVKSMFFNNDFPNSFDGDRVQIKLDVVIRNEADQQGIVTKSDINNTIWLSTMNPAIHSATQQTGPEIARRINDSLDIYVYNFDYLAATSEASIVAAILECTTAGIDPLSGKFQLLFDRSKFTLGYGKSISLPDATQPGTVTFLDTDNWVVDELSYYIVTDSTADVLTQKRVGQLLGLPQSQDTTIAGAYGTQFFDSHQEISLFRNQTAQFVAPLQMDLNWVKMIGVRSTSRSNISYETGKSEGIIDFIPVQTGQLGALETYIRDQKIYAISDSVNGVRRLELRLVDQNDEPIIFLSDYVLSIVIFFK